MFKNIWNKNGKKIVIIALLVAGILIQYILISKNNSNTNKYNKHLLDLSQDIGDWKFFKGNIIDKDNKMLKNTTDHRSAYYLNKHGLKINIFLGYNENQLKNGKLYSPKYVFRDQLENFDAKEVKLERNGKKISFNELKMKNGERIYYFYIMRKKIITNEVYLNIESAKNNIIHSDREGIVAIIQDNTQKHAKDDICDFIYSYAVQNQLDMN